MYIALIIFFSTSTSQVYHHLQRTIVSTPGVYERPYWWRDVTYKNYLERAKL